MVGGESSKPDESETGSPAAPEAKHGFGELRYYVPKDILGVSFPVSVRGYDRRAVDAYTERVNRVIAELKLRASPPAAVRHALEQAEVKVQGLLQAARAAAEEITASAQQDAEGSTARARAEAADLLVNTSADADRVRAEAEALIANASSEADETRAKAKAAADEMRAEASAEAQNTLAVARAEADERLQRSQEELASLQREAEARLRQVRADTEAVWSERRELLDDVRRMAGGLVDVANAAAGRLPRPHAGEPQGELRRADADAETEPPGIPTDELAPAMPTVASDERGNTQSRAEVAERAASGQDLKLDDH